MNISSLLRLLDGWDQWKTIKNLPKRIDILEKTIADLKIEIDNSKNGKRNCVTCGAAPTDITVKDEAYGSGGTIQRIYKTCLECGNIEKIDGAILKEPRLFL